MKYFLNFLFLFSLNIVFAQKQEYEISNTSVNSKFAEIGLSYLNNNRVLFASSKKTDKDKPFKRDRRKHNRELYLELYKGTIDESGDIINVSRFTNDVYNKFFEFDITFTPDLKKIYFAWNNFFSVQSRKTLNKNQPLYLFSASVDSNLNISNILPLTFNSKDYSVRSPRVSKDGKQLFLASNMENGQGEFDLYVSNIFSNGSTSMPKNLGPNVNTAKTELYPYIDQNKILYFSSDGHSPDGRLHIYKSELKDGVYQKPVKLPAPINSDSDDFGFVMSNDMESGYFNSNREQGKGDVDVYAFKRKEIECNQLISGLIFNNENASPLDSVEVSLYRNNEFKQKLIVEKNSKFSFKLKCSQIYKIVAEKKGFHPFEYKLETNGQDNSILDKNINLIPFNCYQTITGIISNSNTNKPLDYAKVKLFNGSKLLNTFLTKQGGEFNFDIKCDETYKIIAEKDYFSTVEVTINTTLEDKEKLSQDLSLDPIEGLQYLSGTVFDKESKLVLPNSLIKIYKDDQLIDSVRTDMSANFNYELDCNQSYKLIASNKDYKNDIATIETSRVPDKKLIKSFYLDSNIEFVTVRAQKMIKTNPIYFDLNDDSIRSDAALELDKVVAIMVKYPLIKLEVKSHTDSRAPGNYNMNLSNKRAKSTISYIISNGINPDRVSGKGYGETELINKCKNGVKCSEEEHQFNRRTEFIVIDN